MLITHTRLQTRMIFWRQSDLSQTLWQCGTPMGLGWDSNGTQMGLQWDSGGTPMRLTWASDGTRLGLSSFHVQSPNRCSHKLPLFSLVFRNPFMLVPDAL